MRRRSRSRSSTSVSCPASQSVHSALGAVASDIALTARARGADAAVAGGRRRPSVDPEHDRGASSATSSAGVTSGSRAQGVPEERRSSFAWSRCVSPARPRRSRSATAARSTGSSRTSCAFTAVATAPRAVPETAGFELVTFVVEATRKPAAAAARAPRPRGDDPAAASRGNPPRLRRRERRHSSRRRSTTAPELRPGNRLVGPGDRRVPGHDRRAPLRPDGAASTSCSESRDRAGADDRAARSTSSARARPTGTSSPASSRSTRSRSRSSATSSRRSTRSRRSRSRRSRSRRSSPTRATSTTRSTPPTAGSPRWGRRSSSTRARCRSSSGT